MAHHSYEESKKLVYRGLVLLAVITLVEVIVSLFGKGHLGWKGAFYLTWVRYIVGFGIIILSLYKAYYIVFEFMHMGSETKSLGRTVLLPMLLLIWAIIAFMYEGNSWNNNRSYVLEQNIEVSEKVVPDLPEKSLEEEHPHAEESH